MDIMASEGSAGEGEGAKDAERIRYHDGSPDLLETAKGQHRGHREAPQGNRQGNIITLYRALSITLFNKYVFLLYIYQIINSIC